MVRTVLAGGVLGGLVLFVWATVSWTALPWDALAVNRFRRPEAVERAILEGAPASGVYALGHPEAGDGDRGAEPGPLVFAAVRRAGPPSRVRSLGALLLADIAAAAVVTAVLLASPGRTRGRRVAVALAFGAVLVLAGVLPDWIWRGFSGRYTLVRSIDALIGWALCGVAIASVIARREAAAAAGPEGGEAVPPSAGTTRPAGDG